MNKLSKILIVFIVLIVLVAGGLGYYTYFVYDNGTNKSPKDDAITFDTAKLNTEVASKLENFPYEILPDNIINLSFDVGNGSKTYIAMKKLEAGNYTQITNIYSDASYTIDAKTLAKKDSEGVKYPDYTNTKDETNKIRLFAQKLGLTVAEIKKMDVKLWEAKDIITNNIIMADSNLVKAEIIRLFKNSEATFDISWRENANITTFFGTTIIYDKNVSKVFIMQTPDSSVHIPKVTKVIETKEEGNNYSIKIIVAPLVTKGEEQILTTSEGDISIPCTDKCVDIDDKTLYQYKDKLNKYQIVFEKINDTYQLQTIKKLDA